VGNSVIAEETVIASENLTLELAAVPLHSSRDEPEYRLKDVSCMLSSFKVNLTTSNILRATFPFPPNLDEWFVNLLNSGS